MTTSQTVTSHIVGEYFSDAKRVKLRAASARAAEVNSVNASGRRTVSSLVSNKAGSAAARDK